MQSCSQPRLSPVEGCRAQSAERTGAWGEVSGNQTERPDFPPEGLTQDTLNSPSNEQEHVRSGVPQGASGAAPRFQL